MLYSVYELDQVDLVAQKFADLVFIFLYRRIPSNLCRTIETPLLLNTISFVILLNKLWALFFFVSDSVQADYQVYCEFARSL